MIITSAAQAGDSADLEVWGVSNDGAYFAFEQYGIQDGSGFPYADFFILQTKTNSWHETTPLRVVVPDDAASVEAARGRARSKAGKLLLGLGIDPSDSVELVEIPVVDSANSKKSRFSLPGSVGGKSADGAPVEYELTLDEQKVDIAACSLFAAPAKKLALTLANRHDGMDIVRITAPEPEGCAFSYGLTKLLEYRSSCGRRVLVALLNVDMVGYEGPTRRFSAVAFNLE